MTGEIYTIYNVQLDRAHSFSTLNPHAAQALSEEAHRVTAETIKL